MQGGVCQFPSGLPDAPFPFLGLYPNLEDYHAGDYFDLQNACFTPLRPQLHSNYIAPEEAARLTQLMRMNYETMHLSP